MKKRLVTFSIVINIVVSLNAQWLNSVDMPDMNSWSSKAGFLQWYNHTNNTPNGQLFGNGIQLILGSDPRHGAQLVIPIFDPNIYFRRYLNGTWDNWIKIWHTGNFNPSTFIPSSANSIVSSDTRSTNYLPYDRNAGVYFDFKFNTTDGLADVNLFHGVMTFRPYGGSGDFSGGLAHQLAFTDNGNMWLRSGSNATWSAWTKIYSDKNINRSDIDFNAKNLYVNGNIWAKEVRVALTNPWADFVFDPSYKLKTLAEVENYIKIHGHLSEIPSATEVEKSGFSLGDMQTKLLQKIEELTLYVIEKDKEIVNLKTAQEKKYNQLESELQQLKMMIKTNNENSKTPTL